MVALPNLTITAILDRCHDINQTIPGLHCRRYFPSSLAHATMPMAVPMQSTGTYNNTTFGSHDFVHNQTVNLILFAGNLMSGFPTQSAQEVAETYTDLILTTYEQRPRLEITGQGDALHGMVEECALTQSVILPSESLLMIRFTLLVPALHTITRY